MVFLLFFKRGTAAFLISQQALRRKPFRESKTERHFGQYAVKRTQSQTANHLI
jgi:hypothetical protein